MSLLSSLPERQAALLADCRRAVLATTRPDGRARLVPIAFAADVERDVLYSPLDEKRKSVADPRRLARVTDVAADSRVSVLLDRWDEDWQQLAWLRLDGSAVLLEPADPAAATEQLAAVRALRQRYVQYAGHALEQRPVLRIDIERASGWSAA